jgi:hypothetical protein
MENFKFTPFLHVSDYMQIKFECVERTKGVNLLKKGVNLNTAKIIIIIYI